MKTPKKIELLARRIRLTPNSSADARILSAAQAALNDRMDDMRVNQTRLRERRIMKRSITKLAIAAAVVVATVIGMHLFDRTSGTTWAKVLIKVNGFDTCVYRSREVETTGPRPDGFEFATESESKNYRSEIYGTFSENYKNGELFARHYMMLQEKQHLSLAGYEQGHMLCVRMALTERSLREFRDHDPRQIVARILAGDYVELGQDTIEGKRVRGVELRDPNVLTIQGEKTPPLDEFSSRFWIDAETALPVWMEISFVRQGSAQRTTMILDQFEWGVPLAASLFKPEIPPGVEVEEDDGFAPDSTPKTDLAETFARRTLAEPFLGDFDHLPLPDVSSLSLLGVDTSGPKPQVRLLGSDEIRLAQDACVAKWPPYEQVRAQLRQELQAALDIDAMDVNGLATTGIALRNRFWELGGTLSDAAYPCIYAARLVDEIAHEKAPNDSPVTDQLVESIGAYEVLYYWEHPETEALRRNPIYRGLVADLRRQQFEQFKAGVGQGDRPTWKDFVRCCDFVYLWSQRDPAAALEATILLIEQAPVAGWTFYREDLKRTQERLTGGEWGYVTTFIGGHQGVYLDQYSRRLWSFQGPQEFRDNRLPMHLRHLKGW